MRQTCVARLFRCIYYQSIGPDKHYERNAAFTYLLPGEIGMAPYKVAAKANPWRKEDGSHDFTSPTYGLRPNLVKEQLRKSIEVLG